MDYRPNNIDDLSINMDRLRTKSFIVDKFVLKDIENKQRSSYLINNGSVNISKKTSRTPNKLNQSMIDTPRTTKSDNPGLTSSKSLIDLHENDFENLANNSFRSEKKSKQSDEPQPNKVKKGWESSLSEVKIKSMVHVLKNSNKLSPKDDLVSFLNNKLNQGYLSLKTAFEYIDPDHLGHLLTEEFRIVLEEFNIYIDNKSYHRFLKK
jgi:hypothetical protein